MSIIQHMDSMKKLSEVMRNSSEIKEVKFNHDNNTFDVVTDSGTSTCSCESYEKE